MKVLILYFNSDILFARRVKRLLNKNKVQASLRKIHFFSKKPLKKTLPSNILDIDIYCFIISKKSSLYNWTTQELPSNSVFLNPKVFFLIPLIIEETVIPNFFYDLDFIDFKISFSKGFDQLLYLIKVKRELNNLLDI